MYPLVQTLRGHEHDLGTTGDLRCSQRHRIDQNLPYPQRYKFHSRERKREFTEKEREREREVEPLKMSFWPRVRTLVRGWRRDLRWVMVESGERVSGIDLPLNLIEIVMSLLSPLPFPFGSAAPPSSIAVLCLVAGSLMSGYRLSASVCVSGSIVSESLGAAPVFHFFLPLVLWKFFSLKYFWQKVRFISYIFKRFIFYSLHFIFIAFSFYPKKHCPFWFLPLLF